MSYPNSGFFSIFLCSYEFTLLSFGTATSIILPMLSRFSTITVYGLLPSTTLSHCMLVSYYCLTFSDSITPWDWCSYHFSAFISLYFSQVLQCIILVKLSCLLLYSFCADMLRSLVTRASSFFPHILRNGDSPFLPKLNLT